MNLVTTRTITAALTNDREGVVCDLDSLARSGSKIWNVARWTISRIWDHTEEILNEGSLKSYMKTQACWKDLNAQSSQAIVEELAGAFQSWFEQDDQTLTHRATAKTEMNAHVQRSHSKKTASNSTRNTSKSASPKART